MDTGSTEPTLLNGPSEQEVKARSGFHWLPWLFGLALLAVVIMAARHFSEARDFALLLEQVEPWWFAAAFALQFCTYLAYGQIYRSVARASRFTMSLSTATKLGIAKLFIDQAVPSAGLSGMIVLANAFERIGMQRATAAAAIVVNLSSFYATFVVSLAVATGITVARGEVHTAILIVTFVFLVFAIGLVAFLFILPGRRTSAMPRGLMRLLPIRMAINFVQNADLEIIRKPGLLAGAVAYQLLIVLCDAATIWVLIRSLGGHASPGGVFASFMFSSLLRTIGFMPGGLGTFEAASVVTLRMAGVPTAMALAATLLFRGLSFWLPMLPGLWFSRHMMYRSALKPEPTPASPSTLIEESDK